MIFRNSSIFFSIERTADLNQSNPSRNRLLDNLPWAFLRMAFSASFMTPSLYDWQKAIVRTKSGFSIFSGTVIWVSSILRPRVFKQRNRVFISHLLRYRPMASSNSILETTIIGSFAPFAWYKEKNINVLLSPFPIGAIKDQDQLSFKAEKGEY